MIGTGGNCPSPQAFLGTVQNNSWVRFEATATTVNLDFTVTGCADGIQVGILQFNGSDWVRFSDCNLTDGGNNGTFTVTGTGLTVGETYYLMMDGNMGANCDYLINVAGGTGVAVVDAGVDQTICGGSVNLSATGPTSAVYTWHSLDGVVTGAVGANQTFSPTVTTTYVVEITGGGVCESKTDTVVVTVGSGSVDATISSAGPFCQSDAALNLSAVDAGGIWSGTGITDANAGTFNPAAAGPGTHTITYTISGGCSDTDTEDIIVNSDQDASFSYPQSSYCLIDPDPAATITGTTGGIFTINNGGSINAGDGTIDIGTSGAGSYTVTYTTAGPCADVQTFAVTLTAGADATITAAGPFCESDAAVTLSAVDGGGTWTGTGITNGTTGAFDPATAGPGTHTITYIITGSCGDTDTEDILVNADQDASFSYSSGSYCLTDPDPGATITGTIGGAFTIDNGGSINAADGTIDIGTSGSGSYTVTYTTAGPCADVQTFAVTLTSGADATITAAGPYCESDAAVTLSAVDAGGTWTGTGITNGTTGAFDPATAGPGTHTITYTITGSCGDTDTEDIVVTADDDAAFDYPQSSHCLSGTDPVANILGTTGGTFTIDNGGSINAADGTIDLDASGTGSYTVNYTTTGTCPDVATFAITITNALDATITAAGPFCEDDAAVNLSAVDAGGTWSGTGITDANAGTFDPATAGAGTHTITYTIVGACGATDTEDIIVNALDDASFSYATTSYCLSDTDPTATISGTAGGTFSIDNGGTIDPSTGEIGLATSGAGTFTVTYTTNGTCPVTSTASITINSSVSATITPAGPYCLGSGGVTLAASTPGGVWSGTGITDTTAGLFNADTAGAGVHQIIYTIAGNCGGADTIDILVSQVPDPNLPTSYTVDYGSSVQITATGGGTYTWDPTENLDCYDCASPMASPEVTTVYCVTVADGACIETACTTVIVEYNCGEVAVPTAFSPNSGDVNSMECVLGECVTGMHFRIYDRWGELVFESTDQSICWDGTHKRNGMPMSTGVYVYQLEADLIDGTSISQKGNITLIR
jgi:gliding motility-associated-like protein